ncbi:hypothetical protein [Rhizobium binxianense]
MSEKLSPAHPALTKYAPSDGPERGYPDLHDHILELQRKRLLLVVDEPINKDTEMHPLVRCQYRGGVPEADRKAFLFTQPTDSKGKRYDSALGSQVWRALRCIAMPTDVAMNDPVPR